MKKGLPDSVSEFDDYPPIYGIEAIPYHKFKELLAQ
jgi:hypothetical protein